MLKGIPAIISPELLKVLSEMGHGDTLVIGDGNFAAKSLADYNNHINIRMDGHGAEEVLDSILKLFPIDIFVDKPVGIMQKMEIHKDMECPIHKRFEDIVAKYDSRGKECVEYIDRFEFYERSKKAYAIISTTETEPYACILVQKGCV